MHYLHRCGQWRRKAQWLVQSSRASNIRASITPPLDSFLESKIRAGWRGLPDRSRDLQKRHDVSSWKPYPERNKFPSTFPSLYLLSAVLPVIQTQLKSKGR